MNERESDDNSNHDVKFDKKFLELPDSCPASAIVNDNDNLKKIARLLYLKYIKIGSEWEINIGYDERSRLMNIMHDENIWMNESKEFDNKEVLYFIFDDCIETMTFLLGTVFSRFKYCDKFLLLRKSDTDTI